MCGTDACVIIYGPNQPHPEVWPSHQGVQDLISKFKAMPKMERSRNMFNKEIFLKKMLTHALEKLVNLKDENKKMEMEIFIFQCVNTGSIVNNANNVDMNYVLRAINQNLMDIDELKKGKDETQHGTIMAPNGAGAFNRENATVGDDVKGMMENHDWAFNFGNDGGDVTLPFGDDNLSNDIEHGSSTP
ncbi:PREDICTED: agamous-like MADS-box protein AGL80 [Lupinus angustifolius]|nr:PREDICTED: agamous-like MADS-box protein AGL80 [Lupinus angustifolius]